MEAYLDRQKLLAEELQHRVRNNLQMVSGVLTSFAQTVPDRVLQQGISLISLRVVTLAAIYDSLLGVGLSETIDLSSYLQNLCSSLPGLQDDRSQKVNLEYHGDTLLLPLESVTAIGIAATELVMNSYRHAFPDDEGTITVTLARSTDDSRATLSIRDNGVGFAPISTPARRGLGIVRRLMKQIDGMAHVQSHGGTLWTLGFPVATP